MSLLTTVGKKPLSMKIIIASVYILLILGSITMIYPFMIMVSGSFKSEVDVYEYDVIPKYFYNDTMLFRKYLETKYNESVMDYNINTREGEYSFKKIDPPSKLNETKIADWKEFLDKVDMPQTYSMLGHVFSRPPKVVYPEMNREYRGALYNESKGSLDIFNEKYDAQSNSWRWINYPHTVRVTPAWRQYKMPDTKIENKRMDFKALQPKSYFYYLSLDGKYIQEYLYFKYGKKIEDYNKAHSTNYENYSQVFLSQTLPINVKERADWVEFVKKELNLQFIKVNSAARDIYAGHLRKKYDNNISLLNKSYNSDYKSFEEINYPKNILMAGSRLVDWEEFIQIVPENYLSLTSPEFLWRDFLENKYGNTESLNKVHETAYASFKSIPMPTKEADYAYLLGSKKHFKWEFATRNYKHVFQYLITRGRGVWNTFVFCSLTVLFALIVNPMAAYAMSRYNLPSTYKILMIFLATMAFPPMVTAIPNFLMIKQLGLLNTFAALILPRVVHGYSIFLLKGFFDSLPKELYESAMIDGANEWTMFWDMTMYLSKPILAVIALEAFNTAYGAFMFAFIVCQDEKMWTLMVWLYQLQQYSHTAVNYAALIVAAIPTLGVFLLAQRFIIKGIVVPVEK
ncbi:MAG: hypothetical protein A2252_06925 [Elusimicrobia bacterium RIFOXYA2_FULL_39_19]|nr:MAG: hypothetical protein A2252_06925 [Elusimicrobia bacterium RIFOXYA2_FULL_39_19]